MEEPKVPRRASKKDRIDALLHRLDEWIKAGDTPEQAIERLTPAQYDFLIDCDIELDDLLLTPEQQANAKAAMKAPRTCKPGGYNKKYPQAKQDLYNSIVSYLVEQGATIEPREKPNFRDLDFTIQGVAYRIVLSNPRK